MFISSTVFSDSNWSFSIISFISPAASSDCDASFWISDATTAKPFPASPALADSIEALRAKRLVWSAIFVISAAASPILPTDSFVILIWLAILLIDSVVWSLESERCV